MKGHRKGREEGGVVQKGTVEPDSPVKDVYAGKGSNVEKEADERKHGGRAKRKRGGHVMPEHAIKGEHGKARADRKARKSGGKVGSDKSPLSSAAKGTQPAGHKSEASW